ncbi:MAG: efflux RND transporter periplasmic adaptor subunit [Vicinamibacterales bacterium]
MDSQERRETPAAPAETARAQGQQTAGTRRHRLVIYVAIAAVSLAAGVGATWFVLRPDAPAPAAGTAPSPEAIGTTGSAHAEGHAASAPPGDPGTDPGVAKAVYISPARQQLIGVRTADVTHRPMETTIRTTGVIAFDETRMSEIHTKIAGWVNTVSADAVGKQVRRGQPLFTVYSPDLVATQKEYLLALKAVRQLGTSQIEETREGARSLLSATEERLRLWDVTDAQIAELTRTGEPRKYLTVYAPTSGVITERNAFPGQYVTPEAATFKIADLSTVWVIGQVFEYELGLIKPGQAVQVEFPYGQSIKQLTGKLTFVYPEIDPQTRRAKVRVEFANPGLQFKPQSYVTVLISVNGGHQLAIPREAVIDNGDKRYAILARPNGYFEPRLIEVAPPVNDYYPVLSGLDTGDVVVTSAQFLIDSESNLQTAMQAMSLSMPGMEMGGAAPKGQDAGSGDMKGMDMAPKKPEPKKPQPPPRQP